MILFLRRHHPLAKLIYITLLIVVVQLVMICFFMEPIDEEISLILLNNTSPDYQFIKSNFPNASEGSWQYISDAADTGNKFLAFSAFLDSRSSNKFINVITVAKNNRKFRRQVWCKLWYEKIKYGIINYYTLTVPGEYLIIKEHWQLPYSPYYIHCPIKNLTIIPNAVSLVADTDTGTPKNLFRVISREQAKANRNIFENPPTFRNLAVCVKPMHYNYNAVMEFVQFIELHLIMGVEHFFLYNHTVGSQVNCLLKNYVKEGLVTILPWQLPLVSQKEIRTEGIFAAFNDCLYRTMFLYSHTMFIDFDEYIFPINNFTYMEFFGYLNARRDISKKSAFLFQNAFFYRQWADDPEIGNFNDPLAANLLLLKKTRRKKKLHPHRTRSKYIVRPELINMVGNHFIWEYANSKFKELNIYPNDGILHHYRVCEFGGDDCVTEESVVDRTAYKYKDELIRTVRNRTELHRTECQLNKFIYIS